MELSEITDTSVSVTDALLQVMFQLQQLVTEQLMISNIICIISSNLYLSLQSHDLSYPTTTKYAGIQSDMQSEDTFLHCCCCRGFSLKGS